MGCRLNVGFKSRLKLGLFLGSYIYSERGDFAASFYNTNSILMFFRNGRFLEGEGALKKTQWKSAMSFEIFLNISFKNQPMGAHQKFERPSPAHGLPFKRNRPMGWAGLGWSWPSPLGALVHILHVTKIFAKYTVRCICKHVFGFLCSKQVIAQRWKNSHKSNIRKFDRAWNSYDAWDIRCKQCKIRAKLFFFFVYLCMVR